MNEPGIHLLHVVDAFTDTPVTVRGDRVILRG
jgi:hypothetical protein